MINMIDVFVMAVGWREGGGGRLALQLQCVRNLNWQLPKFQILQKNICSSQSKFYIIIICSLSLWLFDRSCYHPLMAIFSTFVIAAKNLWNCGSHRNIKIGTLSVHVGVVTIISHSFRKPAQFLIFYDVYHYHTSILESMLYIIVQVHVFPLSLTGPLVPSP
jgi:hypothetical protein